MRQGGLRIGICRWGIRAVLCASGWAMCCCEKMPNSIRFRCWSRRLARAEELDEERARIVLVGAARYLAAHAPTARALKQTANLALRLHRGEDLSAEDPDEEVG